MGNGIDIVSNFCAGGNSILGIKIGFKDHGSVGKVTEDKSNSP